MAACYISSSDVDAFIGIVRRQALFNDQVSVGYVDNNFIRITQMASAVVKSAAHNAGYTSLADSSDDDDVKLATIGQFLLMAYGRKGEAVPEQFASAINMAEAIRKGDLELTGLTVNARDAVGGNKWTESSTSITNAAIQIFSRAQQNVY